MKKTKIIASDNLDGTDQWHQYTIKEKKTKKDNTKTVLEASGKKTWNLLKGFKLGTIIDHGNGVVLNGKDYRYDEIWEMYLLLKHYHRNDGEVKFK